MKSKSSSSSPPDVKIILDQLKANVLRGCRLLFSGVIPLGAPPESTEIWQLAKTYGASCEKQLSEKVTHLLAKQEGTLKVQEASKPPYKSTIKIVHPSWLIDSIAEFRRLEEEDYLLIPPAPPESSPRSTTPPIDPPSTQLNGTAPLQPSSSVSTKEDGEVAEGDEVVDEDLEEVVGDIDLGGLDWGQADRELDEFLDESSDEGGDVSETESISSSRSLSTTSNGRKRPRPSSTLSTPSDPTDPSASSSRPSNPMPKRSRMDPASNSQPQSREPSQPSSPNGMEDDDEEEDEEGLFGDESDGGSETGTEGDAGEMEAWAKELEGSFEGS
ncbi:hypothetical protein BDY24DRAFT_66219 [Mrakia frigida]|uniref:BRCT domain-containing protein n=1 Tax=Mrakia frigida TaxID=29902 RepID=UPI003FCBEE9A